MKTGRRIKRGAGYNAPLRKAWPWDDRGRSALTRDQIVEQSVVALREYRKCFGGNTAR